MLEIHQFLCLQDNYGYLIRDTDSGAVAAVDTPDAKEISEQLSAKGWTLTHILNTHHHHDHTGGNEELKAQTNCTIIGPAADEARIPAIDRAVGEDAPFEFGSFEVRVFDTPGHTKGHIALWLPEAKVAFVGDTLFALGCGRLFEGTPEQMWSSLSKLIALPDDTKVYCGHEYTQANAKFALTIEPENGDLKAWSKEIDGLRAAGKPTVPTTIGHEKRTNPFVRPQSAAIQKQLNMDGAGPVDVFAEVRRRKDNF